MEQGRAIADWLIAEARLFDDGVAMVEGLGERLAAAGVPLWRLRVAQRFSNPLLTAWGVIWRSDDAPTRDYVMPTALMETSTWIGSPFQYVTERRKPLRRRLRNLDPVTDHDVFHELAAEGGTDYLAVPVEYGDGSVQGMSVVTDHPDGFSDDHIALIEGLRLPLAAAMEPLAVRRSMASLLKTFLGSGPSSAVLAGSVRRGELSAMPAVVMFSDLRDFTAKSNSWSEAALLAALDSYFDIVVAAVQGQGGDVLKFLGDGVLAVFPVAEGADPAVSCSDALAAVRDARSALAVHNQVRRRAGQDPLEFGTALHLGEVAYGNIGSPDRLDFTVIGETVNLASRVEAHCKVLGEPVLCTASLAAFVGGELTSVGVHELRGLAQPVELFKVTDL